MTATASQHLYDKKAGILCCIEALEIERGRTAGPPEFLAPYQTEHVVFGNRDVAVDA